MKTKSYKTSDIEKNWHLVNAEGEVLGRLAVKVANILVGKNKAKYYSNAKTKHLIPVNISKKNHKKVNEIALKAHKLLKCKGITRSDFKFYKNKFYLLEINTQPGMTDLSLVPEVAAYRGIDFRSLIVWMIEDASKKR